ncbi:MAG: preprotein translocase subunit SecE [Chloroflexi bacterium]|nr:preprotein translocase subunit SecE [Chloroflexota bacterium]
MKKSSPDKKQKNQQNPISRYIRETRGELRKVTWPSREESWRLTAIVLTVTLLMSAFLWLFDTLFSNSIEFVLQRVIGL